MRRLLSKLSEFGMTSLRQVLPIGGVAAWGWHPFTGLAVYWVEALLLAVVAAAYCALAERRTAYPALEALRRAGRHAEARQLEEERAVLKKGNLRWRNVFAFNVGSLLIFGIFFGAITGLLAANGEIDRPDMGQVRDGVSAMLTLVLAGVLFDLLFTNVQAPLVEARVNACLTRWVLFWFLGFVGTIVMAWTGRPAIFFTFFGGLKVTWEVLGTAGRLFTKPATAGAPA